MNLVIGGFVERLDMRHQGHLTVKQIPCIGGGQDIVHVHSHLCLLCGDCETPVDDFDELGLIELEFIDQHPLFDL